MLSHLKKYEILLASNSPRRRELLAGLDIDYRVTALPEVNESYPDTLSGEEIPLYISQEKAAAYRRFMKDNTLLITADTIVWLDGKVYGKPRDIADAKAMLQALSGKTHTVITGVTLTSLQKQISFAVSTEVTFAALGDDEIDYYVETYRPLDKAGAYGIQGKGSLLIQGIQGDYFTVMGLPVSTAFAPRTRPSVLDMAMQRTTSSPMCCATSSVMVSAPFSTVMAPYSHTARQSP